MTSGKRLAFAIGIGLHHDVRLFVGRRSAVRLPATPTRPRGVYRSGLTFGGSLGLGLIDGPNCFSVCGGGLHGRGAHRRHAEPAPGADGDWLGWAPATSTTPAIGTGSTYNSVLDGQPAVLGDRHHLDQGRHRLRPLADLPRSRTIRRSAYDDETGGAITGAAGIEVVQSYNWALDLQVRAGHAFYNGGDLNNLAFMVGFNWY